MRTLTYWACACLDDSDVYNIRARTRREAVEQRQRAGTDRFGPPVKVKVDYTDAFDLLQLCLSEARVYEGSR